MTATNTPLAFIIEDDLPQAKVFDQALQDAGYATELFHDGQSALARLAEIQPQIVILDLHLPEIAGQDVLRTIRASTHLEETRIIIATADYSLGETLDPIVDMVLIKPISYIQLREMARRMRK